MLNANETMIYCPKIVWLKHWQWMQYIHYNTFHSTVIIMQLSSRFRQKLHQHQPQGCQIRNMPKRIRFCQYYVKQSKLEIVEECQQFSTNMPEIYFLYVTTFVIPARSSSPGQKSSAALPLRSDVGFPMVSDRMWINITLANLLIEPEPG